MQQIIYQSNEHKFPIDLVDKDALYVIETLQKEGFVAYLVGGSVRDLLLGKTPKDYDISTSAKPEEIRKIFRNCILIGRRFRLAHIRFGKKVIEVATFRSGDTNSEHLILRDNEWGTPEEDALRRDFTINGLFYDPLKKTIIDFVEGYRDVQEGLLRTIGFSYLRFKQDPVRMIRLLKFQARFGLQIDEEAKIALTECRHEIVKSSSARVLEEILRMLESGSAQSFFKLITHHGLVQLIFPALGAFLETHEGEAIYEHLEEIDEMLSLSPHSSLDRSILLACLAFPCLEKRIDRHFIQRKKIPHLGEIYQETDALLNELFPPLCRLPRRLKGALTSILVYQYRLTPLDKKKPLRCRISSDPDFLLAATFLQIRAAIDPTLSPTCEEWTKQLSSSEKIETPRKRKPRRKKKKTSIQPPESS